MFDLLIGQGHICCLAVSRCANELICCNETLGKYNKGLAIKLTCNIQNMLNNHSDDIVLLKVRGQEVIIYLLSLVMMLSC